MKTQHLAHICLLILMVLSASGQSTAITYQGHLKAAASSVNGTVDMKFTVYEEPTGGSALAGSLTVVSAW